MFKSVFIKNFRIIFICFCFIWNKCYSEDCCEICYNCCCNCLNSEEENNENEENEEKEDLGYKYKKKANKGKKELNTILEEEEEEEKEESEKKEKNEKKEEAEENEEEDEENEEESDEEKTESELNSDMQYCEKKLRSALNICKNDLYMIINRNIIDKLSRIALHKRINLNYILGNIYTVLMSKEFLFDYNDEDNFDVNDLLLFINKVIQFRDDIKEAKIKISYDEALKNFLFFITEQFELEKDQLKSINKVLDEDTDIDHSNLKTQKTFKNK